MPDTFPLTSIIIPNYNGLRFLTPCLDALRAQSYPRELTEIILVDDASTDNSVAFVTEHYPEVKIVQLARNSGLAVGCNAGARTAAGALLVMLNNDTEVEPGWLVALVEAATANPQAGAIASKMLLFDRRDTLHNAGDLMGADGIPRNRGVWQVDQGQFDGQPQIFGGCGGGVMYRRGLGSRPAASTSGCSCTWRTWTWRGDCNYWDGRRSLRRQRGSITTSARRAAGSLPATM